MPGINVHESSPFLLVFLLGYCLAVIEGELRCYCNESGCVSTSYMCKSSAGQCYTAVEVRGEVTHQTHGCLDHLPEEQQASCRESVDVISASGKGPVTLPLLLCCTDHMCNYIRDDFDVSIILTPKYNGTFHRGTAPTGEDNPTYSKNNHGNRDDDRDLWFKAAVIAVPIAGGFILVLLVLLAVRMLRTDSRYQRRFNRRERSLTKAHMYIAEHFVGKTGKQPCSLFTEKPSKHCPTFYADIAGPDSRCGNVCPTLRYGDIYSNHCSYAVHGEGSDVPTDSSAALHGVDRAGSSAICHHSNSSLPCSSSGCYSDASSHSCSTKAENCVHCQLSHSTIKPCSFYSLTDPVSKAPCLRRDVTVKIDRFPHMVPRFTKSEISSPVSNPGHAHSSVVTWNKVCEQGPASVV
ncbi:BMP and activin membrane-bound inhibitor homolog [Physella acuta]|uniref:BMP and activin membrane-bound inhibitor homolog n=1 Tax=Physella acuta TaxID=109671 RepID=UPI0027DCB868|nr:BMP and activin membrane-bound inhibitor homolog [Physella acuta]